MKPQLNILNLSVLLSLCLWTFDAEARFSERTGFNFGTSLGVSSGSDRGTSSANEDSKSALDSSSTSVQPYMGFVLGNYFNLGLALGFQNTSTSDLEQNDVEGFEVRRLREGRLRHASLIIRFLFAEVMFFEAGAGVYDRKVSITNETMTGGNNGSFNARREEYSLRGTGPGYHAGGGFEIPIDRMEGFYFTTSYMVRFFTLRENATGIHDLGKKSSQVRQQELTFGISHYVTN